MACENNSSAYCNYKGSYTKDELMRLLNEVNASDSVMIGQQSNINGDSAAIAKTLSDFKQSTGEDLPIIGFDVRFSNLAKLGESGCNQVLGDLIDYASKGGIITASAHFSNPKNGDPAIESYRGSLGDDDVWQELTKKGSALNESFTRELSGIADFFEKLDKYGIPVIWRPLHEANGCWFWFCMVQKLEEGFYKISEERYRELWIYIYDYLTRERGLTNLIWSYSPNIGVESDSMVAPLYGYPGDEYVDIVGFDWYTNGNYARIDETLTYSDLASTGKIVTIAEFGPTAEVLAKDKKDQPDLFSCKDMLKYLENLKNDGKRIAYILNWTDVWSIKAIGYGDVLMNSPLTLSLGDVNKLFKNMR